MDRLFLTELVGEIGAVARGARVGAARLDDGGNRSLTLSLRKPGAPSELVFHLAPGTAGVFTRNERGKSSRASAREAKLEKLLASSVVVSMVTSELDRVVTVVVEQTRLSGKKRRVELVFELVAGRSSLFILDGDSKSIVDVVSSGTARLAVGDRYRALSPPPSASTRAASADELERRLERAGGATDRDSLLRATGWTPLLVREMRFLMDAGASPRDAFEELDARLEARQPFLYVDPVRATKVVLSPIALSRETSPRPPMAGFNEAMAEAVRLTVSAERSRSLRERMSSAATKRRKKLRSLVSKLEREREQLPPTAELRRRGETLLAGLARAERVDDARVRVPDAFHPDGDGVEIEIDPRLGLAENAERLFRRSRKVERSERALAKRLEAIGQQMAYLDEVRVSLDASDGLDELDAIREEMEEQGLLPAPRADARSRGAGKRLPPRRFTTRRGSVVLVGRSARSNQDLTFHVAKPDDLWLHASGIPGSHVVLKRAGSEGDDEDILEAAGYAAHFSKARNDTYVDVLVTERRHVSSIKGAPPGLVKVSNVRTVRVRPTPPPSSEAVDGVG